MNKIGKILSLFGLCGVSFLSAVVYYLIFILFSHYSLKLIIIFSIIMIFVGIALLIAYFNGNASRDTWKSKLGLMLTVNPILFYILYLVLEPSSYTAF